MFPTPVPVAQQSAAAASQAVVPVIVLHIQHTCTAITFIEHQ